jgi:thiosulfate reductase cytochrome b subunit
MPPPTVRRHALATRLWHWVNALTLLVLLMSGLMIFNAHPRLYWGQYGANMDRAWLQIGTTATTGFVEVAGRRVDTTGVLGRWTGKDGSPQTRAFPWWATIPSGYNLALARRWHLAFALVFAFGLLAFLVASLVNRHIVRDLRIRRSDLAPATLWHDVKEHLRLRFHDPDDPAAYNVLQKLSYVAVIFGLIPLAIFTGLAMSPGMDAAWPWLTELFGGRQSARSLHFLAAFGLLGFVLVHLLLVLLSGPVDAVRGMVTGRVRAG